MLWSCVCRCTEFVYDWITPRGCSILQGSDCLTSIYCPHYEIHAILQPRNSYASLRTLFALLSESSGSEPWLRIVTAFCTVTLLLPFQHVKFHEILVCNCTMLRRFYKITGKKNRYYGCRKWFWSHAIAVRSDIDLILWL